MVDLNYQQCIHSEDPVSPQDLPNCPKCTLTIGDCIKLTSVIPCKCEYYSKYRKEWKQNHEKT